MFQCSSASRKFLNIEDEHDRRAAGWVSVLFSEPKIPQFAPRADQARNLQRVSVLFSEPKIPQCLTRRSRRFRSLCFSALQRAENSSIRRGVGGADRAGRFQCSSASRKFLNRDVSDVRSVETLRFQCSSASRKFLNPDPRTCVHPYFRPR